MILGVVFYLLLLLFVYFGIFFFFFVVVVFFRRQGYLSHVRIRLLRLYYASDTLFLVTFSLGGFFFLPCIFRCFHGGVFLRRYLLFLPFRRVSALVPMHTVFKGVINYFAFLFERLLGSAVLLRGSLPATRCQ